MPSKAFMTINLQPRGDTNNLWLGKYGSGFYFKGSLHPHTHTYICMYKTNTKFFMILLTLLCWTGASINTEMLYIFYHPSEIKLNLPTWK